MLSSLATASARSGCARPETRTSRFSPLWLVMPVIVRSPSRSALTWRGRAWGGGGSGGRGGAGLRVHGGGGRRDGGGGMAGPLPLGARLGGQLVAGGGRHRAQGGLG